MHVHVYCSDGEAKFWLEPIIALADYTGLSKPKIKKIQKIVEEKKNEISKSWKKHFKC